MRGIYCPRHEETPDDILNKGLFGKGDIVKLNWMQDHRVLVEKIIKFGNAYANGFKVPCDYGTSVEFSALQIQVFEYILESEDKNEKMSEMATRLGVSKSTFSKNVKSLMEKKMLEKFRRIGNQKDTYVKPTQRGREIYMTYVDWVCNFFFNDMFRIADEITPEDRKRVGDLLDCFSNALLSYCVKDASSEVQEVTLVKVE